jgi:hypothetical protein
MRYVASKYPILKGFIDINDGTVRAYCPYCETWHVHGLDKDMTKKNGSHRAPHCIDGSPFRDGGYCVKLMNKSEIKAIAGSVNNG